MNEGRKAKTCKPKEMKEGHERTDGRKEGRDKKEGRKERKNQGGCRYLYLCPLEEGRATLEFA